MAAESCCLQGFRWEGKPQGHEAQLCGRSCYVTGNSQRVAVIIIHDLFGWTFQNTRQLADHYADEVGATVYIPDFFGGEALPPELILDSGQWDKLDLPNFGKRNNKTTRMPEIYECAKELKSKYERVGAIGFCFGGWGAFRLAAKDQHLLDCVSVAHPTDLEEDEIRNLGVPAQIMAPEIDPKFTPELKAFSNATIPTLNLPYDYQFFPGLTHAFAIRGDPGNPQERKGMQRAKDAAVYWFRLWLNTQ